jgi:hypothetical protein
MRDVARDDVNVSDDGLRNLLLQLSPVARGKLRTILIRHDRNEIAAELLRYGDANGENWANVVAVFTMYPDVRRKVVRMLADIDATR